MVLNTLVKDKAGRWDMEYWEGPAILSKMDMEDFCESVIFEKGQEEIRD